MKKILFTLILCCIILPAMGQNEARKDFDEFTKKAKGEYEDFRKKANDEYADFVRKAWKEYQSGPVIPVPKDDTIPPLVYPKDDEAKPIEDHRKEIKDLVNPIQSVPQPKPITPIKNIPKPEETYFTFTFFGTEDKVRLDDGNKFQLNDCTPDAIADAWTVLATEKFDNVIRDCLALRMKYDLCDWAYLMMLKDLSESFLGKGTNESVVMMAYLFCQSGYKMRFAMQNGKMYLLYGCNNTIYDHLSWTIDGETFYPLDCNEPTLQICDAKYPGETALSLNIDKEQLFALDETPQRVMKSQRYPNVVATVTENNNLMDFFATYPTSMCDNYFVTRWAYYANTPLSQHVKNTLYPVLKRAIAGKTETAAANIILNFVQTALTYEYDDTVWGQDRAFFPDETIKYPYCDCEDHAILFTRIVRDLMGLKTLLIYYPGHLASAVKFDEQITGDYLIVNNSDRYLVCDPTYVGAPIGVTMPGMDNGEAQVVLLP
jgi:hypothetical protein